MEVAISQDTLATPKSDDRLFRELMDRFTILAEMCSRFSQEVYRWSGTLPEVDLEDTVRRNLAIVRTVFGKWSLEVLAVIHLNRSISFWDMQEALGISRSTLTGKVRQLERTGLVQREDVTKRTTESRYFLTHKGLMIARLGEPVFLYLRVASGWSRPESGGAEPAEESGAVPTAADDT